MLKKTLRGIVLIVAVLTVSMLAFSVQKVKGEEIIGDLNGDGVVNQEDLDIMTEAFNTWPGHPRWNPLADLNGDGKVTAMDVCILAHHFGKKITVITVDVKICPRILSLRCMGRWVTAYIEFPEGYDTRDVNISSVLLNGTIRAEPRPFAVGDFDGDGKADLMVKFDRRALIELILENYRSRHGFGKVTLTVTGMLNSGTRFKGSTIEYILKCGKR